ncbi:hypothetical protein EQG49_03750 [Periweissella cryptocerci]|uniref:Uncharacterized protein n=1 Tax=Periweissella cryptocerci TaxID=2506420 RepID=A0A4P6YSN1_9LACO|nr:hypothetical protein [Periweissella cryptocerci]QBO35633.1 hypothetical protein EQG49_03750 [Periweissella cryptocerci]
MKSKAFKRGMKAGAEPFNQMFKEVASKLDEIRNEGKSADESLITANRKLNEKTDGIIDAMLDENSKDKRLMKLKEIDCAPNPMEELTNDILNYRYHD